MKRKFPAKLSLHRETLQQLDGAHLRGAAGGSGARSVCNSGCDTCKPTCNTCQVTGCGTGGSGVQSCQGSCEESCNICPTTLTD